MVFDAGAKCRNTLLNKNLPKGSDLSKNLVGVLLQFRQGKFFVMADIHYENYRNFTLFPGVEILWKGTVYE